MTVKIKDINGNLVEVDSSEIYEGLGQACELRDMGCNYWADNQLFCYTLTKYGFKPLETAREKPNNWLLQLLNKK